MCTINSTHSYPSCSLPHLRLASLRYVILLNDDEHRFVQKVHPARANGHWECGRISNPVATLPHAAVVLYATI